ncbi:MAG: aminopeptidase P family protein [Candidatus Heimdallarchaeota archaeon]|nr:aminopeptidase P family protein [Candidatus Heimdallarchaeota archaeon]
MTLSNQRLQRIQNLMSNSNIGTIIIPLGINFHYIFSSQLEEPSERLLLGIINDNNSPKLLVPNFEIARMKQMTGISDVIGWEETHDPYKQIADLVPHDRQKSIAIEPKMWFSVYNQLSQSLNEYTIVSAENIFNIVRAEKDETERKLILEASQKSGNAIIEVLYELETGMTEIDASKILKEKLNWGIDQKTFALVQFGENSALPHYHGGEKKLEKNNVVLIDAGGSLENYWGDITITAVWGEAPRDFKEIFDIVYTANENAKAATNDNKLPGDIDAAARDYIRSFGYGEYFTHRTGHGIGLEVHEHPYIVGKNHNPLKTGNAFTIEPGIYLPEKFGVRIEDNVIKTEEGIRTSEIPRYEIMEI